jgi:DDE superfamily endonuclease
VAADSRAVQIGGCCPHLHAQKPGSSRARGNVRRVAVDDQPSDHRDNTAIGEALGKYVPTADELDDQQQYVVDGTLLPCWSWAGHPELYSGKHKTTGMNVQVACTLDGDLSWISDPIDGARHDTHCLRESGALPAEAPTTG